MTVNITEVTIFSIDKSESESWSIEGEIIFEEDLAVPFSAAYFQNDDELEDLEMEPVPGRYDGKTLKNMIIKAAKEYED